MTRARNSARWTRVSVDDRRCLVYGAGWGRFYLFDPRDALEPSLQFVLGLRSADLCESIRDPVERIGHDRPSLRDHATVASPYTARLAYWLLHWSRWVIPLHWMARIIQAFCVRIRTREHTLSNIGRTMFDLEQTLGFEDCYPRALLTLYLCLRAGHSCELLVGCLVPTRKMHTWCCSSGILPYEALPEHYMYQPLYAHLFES